MKMIDVLVIAFMRKEVTLLSLPHSNTLFFSNFLVFFSNLIIIFTAFNHSNNSL